MKKYEACGVIAALTLLGASVSLESLCGYAEEAKKNTDAVVKFVPSDDPISPVDPEKPTVPVTPINPIDPTKPVEPGTKGPLSLDYASSLFFGEQKITTVDKVYYAKNQKLIDRAKSDDAYEAPNYVQVTDLRGTLKGWSLSVTQNGQFKSTDGDILNGAQIQFNDGTHESSSSSKRPGKVQKVITLTSDGKGSASNVMVAGESEGSGTHILRFGSNDGATTAESSMSKGIQLTVPGKTEKLAKEYSTTLTWTLADTPS